MGNAVERGVVCAPQHKLGTGYVKLELGFRFSSPSASLSDLETQWKGNSANKTSLSDKLACVYKSFHLRLFAFFSSIDVK